MCKTLRMEMNLITPPVPTRASITHWENIGIAGTAEIIRTDYPTTIFSVSIYKINAEGSVEEVDYEEFEDFTEADHWAWNQIDY